MQVQCQSIVRTNRPSTSIAEILPEDEQPLVHPISLARVTLDTAKSIVFMYCSRLPSDAFFSTTPLEIIKDSLNGFQCTIRLPINSPFKQEIQGPVKYTESKASKAAYLKICRILREQDEIDESFIPYTKNARLKKIIEEFRLTCSIDDDEKDLSDGPGTVKRRELYPKKLGKMFANLPITTSTPSCLYSITVEPRNGLRSVGFICSEHVPLSNMVAHFPVYIKTAEFKISVTAVDISFNLTGHQLHQVQLFHQVVFHESLGFKKNLLRFEETSPLYVVPLNAEFGVDWQMIQLTLDRNNYNMSTNHDEKRTHFEFNKNDYNDAMVYRWYETAGLFEVLEVETKTPSSRFPQNNEGYKTYVDYYIGKYNLEVIHTSCPLISVASIGFNSSVKRSEQTKAERKGKPINLVPELLAIFPIPTSFHRQCRLLPAIFYRLCQVYNIERLRETIASEAKFGWKSLSPNHKWGMLNFDCDKSSCHDGNVNKKSDRIVGSKSSSEYESDDNEPPTIQFKNDLSETEIQCEASRVVLTNDKLSEVYGDINELKARYANFSVDAYTRNMRAELFEYYHELLQAPQMKYDPGNDSQYLPQNAEVENRTKSCIDLFSRVKSFDVHTDEPNIAGPTPSLLLQALTTRNAVDMFNMERLETLGDSFLKLTTSAYLYYKLPVLNEGYLSMLKVNQISNSNLCRLGKKKNLAEYMIAHPFRPINNWLPPGFCVGTENDVVKDGEPNHFTKQNISDKSVADCCEALISAYLLTSGPKGAVNFMAWLGIQIMDSMLFDNNGHWLQSPRSGQSSSCDDSEMKIQNFYSTLRGFEGYIGYDFRDKCLLIQAMTHVSYHNNTVTECNQRLEFLGDAVLDYLVTRFIYEDPKQFTPGDMTHLRAALTNNSFFGSLAVKHNFHVHLKLNSYELYRSIHSFADKFNKNVTGVVYGNFTQLMLDEREIKNLDEADIPKALGDVFEAVAGAIYLDSNYSLDAVWRVYYPLMKLEFGKRNILVLLSQNIPIIFVYFFQRSSAKISRKVH